MLVHRSIHLPIRLQFAFCYRPKVAAALLQRTSVFCKRVPQGARLITIDEKGIALSSKLGPGNRGTFGLQYMARRMRRAAPISKPGDSRGVPSLGPLRDTVTSFATDWGIHVARSRCYLVRDSTLLYSY